MRAKACPSIKAGIHKSTIVSDDDHFPRADFRPLNINEKTAIAAMPAQTTAKPFICPNFSPLFGGRAALYVNAPKIAPITV